MKIVIVDALSDKDIIPKYLPQDAELIITDRTTHSDEELIEDIKDADAVISEYSKFNKNVFANCPKLKFVVNRAMGVDNINLEDAREAKVAIASVPDYCLNEVAEHAMALIFSLCRNTVGYAMDVKNGKWSWIDAPKLNRMANLTLGLIGCGRIPRNVARMAQAVGMKVIAYDPYLPAEVAKAANIELMSPTQLAENADVILNHLLLVPETRHFVNADFFKACKKHPLFVSTSRGATVDEHALCQALEDGTISRAFLDVVDSEPADFGSEIFSAKNCFFTPHAAFYSVDAHEEVHRRSGQNVTDFFNGKYDDIRFAVDPRKF